MPRSSEEADDQDLARVVAAIRGLLSVVLPIVAVVIAAVASKAAIEGDLRDVRGAIGHNREIFDGRIDRLRLELDQLRQAHRDHTALGVDGVGHPTGNLIKLRQLETRLEALEKRQQ